MSGSFISHLLRDRVAIAVLALVALVTPVSGKAETNKTPAAANEKLVGKIERQLISLGEDTWGKRENAQNALMELGREHDDLVLNTAMDTYLETGEPEIKLRIRKLVSDLVLELYFQENRAFLGVRLQDSVPLVVDNKTYNPILIGELIPGEVAEKNGFRAGDLILKVDKHVCDGAFRTPQLINYIRSKNPGTEMTYTLFGGGKKETRTVALGSRPVLPGEPPIEEQKKMFVKTRARELLSAARKRAKEAKELAPDEAPTLK